MNKSSDSSDERENLKKYISKFMHNISIQNFSKIKSQTMIRLGNIRADNFPHRQKSFTDDYHHKGAFTSM
jgi:hypothetical protein